MLLPPARIKKCDSKEQFYTYCRPDNILWFQRIRQRMGFAERRAEGIWASNAPGAYSFQSGDMDYTFSLPQNAATESGNSGTEMVLGERFAPGRFALTKANTFPHNELPASRRSDGLRDHPGLAFRFPSK